MAVLMGSQLPACWHVPLRLTARIAMASRDGTVAEHRLAVRRLAEGGKRREKGVFTDGDRCFQGWSEDGARLLSTCVDNGERILYIHMC